MNLRAVRPWVLAAVLVSALAGCGSGAASPSQSPSPPPATAADFSNAACTALGEFSLAWGNPDTNIKSDAWKKFDAAIKQKDAGQLEVAATEILAHLEAARTANARGSTWAPGAAASTELEAVLVALETEVTTVRAARGDPGVAAQAETTMQATWPHFLTYLQKVQALIQSKAFATPTVPCAAIGTG
jgi:hypothetical protein